MIRPSRATTSGRVYLELRARARREQRPTDELLTLYVLERFLYRLSVSPQRQRLVLKGGMLLAALGQRRPTRDVDLLAKAISTDIDTIADLIRTVVTIDVDDGVVYHPNQLTAALIREQELYHAVRITIPALVNRARHPLRVDVNVGDPVVPPPTEVDYPALLGESFPVVSYPVEAMLAEKLVTMVARGDTTTRDRDFADVVLMIGLHPIDAAQLSAAVTATASHRRTELRPLTEVFVTLGSQRQPDWQRFLARTGLQSYLPPDYEDAIRRVAAFADPILTATLTAGRWDHLHARWTAS